MVLNASLILLTYIKSMKKIRILNIIFLWFNVLVMLWSKFALIPVGWQWVSEKSFTPHPTQYTVGYFGGGQYNMSYMRVLADSAICNGVHW